MKAYGERHAQYAVHKDDKSGRGGERAKVRDALRGYEGDCEDAADAAEPDSPWPDDSQTGGGAQTNYRDGEDPGDMGNYRWVCSGCGRYHVGRPCEVTP